MLLAVIYLLQLVIYMFYQKLFSKKSHLGWISSGKSPFLEDSFLERYFLQKFTQFSLFFLIKAILRKWHNEWA